MITEYVDLDCLEGLRVSVADPVEEPTCRWLAGLFTWLTIITLLTGVLVMIIYVVYGSYCTLILLMGEYNASCIVAVWVLFLPVGLYHCR